MLKGARADNRLRWILLSVVAGSLVLFGLLKWLPNPTTPARNGTDDEGTDRAALAVSPRSPSASKRDLQVNGPHSRENLNARLLASPLAAFATDLDAAALPSIRIRPTRNQAPLGASRFGGLPDVPEAFEWPRGATSPLRLLAQINFAEVPNGTALGLPADGWLLLFYDTDGFHWGFDPKHSAAWRIVYVSSGTTLRRTASPSGGEPIPECVLVYSQEWTLPAIDSLDLPASVKAAVAADETLRDEYKEMQRAWFDGDFQHRLLGHPWLLQSDMRKTCALVTNGIYCGDGDYTSKPGAREIAERWPEWRLLLQLDTDGHEVGPRWIWGDSGILFLMIRKEDLAHRAFERGWCFLQSF